MSIIQKLSSLPKNKMLQSIAVAVVSVMLTSWLRIRPLGLLFLAFLGFWYYKTKCNLRILPPPELQKKFENLLEYLRELRQTNPTMFCIISSSCLGALAILGHILSSSTVVLIGLMLAAIISTKYNFKVIRIEPKDFAWTEKFNHDPELDDEFIPDVDEKNLFVLERASDLATLSSPTEDAEEEDKSDDVPSELLIPDPIPEITEHSSDENNDDELIPIVKKPHKEDVASSNQAIEFKKKHFKRDSSLSTSSSSSEESLSKGLQFPDHTTVVDAPTLRALPASNDSQDAIISSIIKTQITNNSSKLIPNLVSGIMQWGMGIGSAPAADDGTVATVANPPPQQQQPPTMLNQRRKVTALDSSDDSDFEILDNDDFK